MMMAYCTMQEYCVGLTVYATENSLPDARANGLTIVSLNVGNLHLVLGCVSPNQLDSLASDLRQIAHEVRIGVYSGVDVGHVADALPAVRTEVVRKEDGERGVIVSRGGAYPAVEVRHSTGYAPWDSHTWTPVS